MTTKRILSDQVQYVLSAGYPDVADIVQREDVFKQIEQKINSMFKMQQFSINLPSGETIPDNLSLAVYEDILVTRTFNEQSKATLPVMPISLPRNAGINEIRPVLNVTDSGDRMLGQPFIPLIAGQDYLLKSDSLLNDLMGQVSYSPTGSTVIFSKDVTILGITKVDMKLVVFDMSLYDEFAMLPVPVDMEDAIVQDVIKFFAPVQSQPSIVSNYPIPNK